MGIHEGFAGGEMTSIRERGSGGRPLMGILKNATMFHRNPPLSICRPSSSSRGAPQLAREVDHVASLVRLQGGSIAAEDQEAAEVQAETAGALLAQLRGGVEERAGERDQPGG